MSAEKALVLGGDTGLLGQEITNALEKRGWTAVPVGRNNIDILDREQIEALIKNKNITHIFNCIAYTRVDDAEDEHLKASLINCDFPKMLGDMAQKNNLYLIHFSTDFVFDGKQKEPYSPQDTPNPLNVYGKTKLDAEKRLTRMEIPKLLIIRTAWLFGPTKINFVTKILKLAQDKKTLDVVHDQIGSPTYTVDLAEHALDLVEKNARGIFHVVNSGEASWCELAAEALACVGSHTKIHAVDSSHFRQKAVRPEYSVLDNSSLIQTTSRKPRPWAQALRDFLYHTEIKPE
ncbi:MAG: dTDP-4-dehydrorhamnose reductase [Desulfovibrionales bacterium]